MNELNSEFTQWIYTSWIGLADEDWSKGKHHHQQKMMMKALANDEPFSLCLKALFHVHAQFQNQQQLRSAPKCLCFLFVLLVVLLEKMLGLANFGYTNAMLATVVVALSRVDTTLHSWKDGTRIGIDLLKEMLIVAAEQLVEIVGCQEDVALLLTNFLGMLNVFCALRFSEILAQQYWSYCIDSLCCWKSVVELRTDLGTALNALSVLLSPQILLHSARMLFKFFN